MIFPLSRGKAFISAEGDFNKAYLLMSGFLYGGIGDANRYK
jgi:hypothetical protein